jgi:cytochrome bd ubiquinol oxidase subunit I
VHGFLEASFLLLMLFGWKRVGAWLRTPPFVLVAIGTTIPVSGSSLRTAGSRRATATYSRTGIAPPVSWLHVTSFEWGGLRNFLSAVTLARASSDG